MNAPLRHDAPAYQGESYYRQPPVKAAHWDWTVSGYIFLAGMGGAAQVLATVAYRRDPARFGKLRRNARFIGTAGAAAGAALLIADLKTPQRFYNMVRIFRPTSPMSIGSYILGAFGAFSGIGALSELFPRARRLRALGDYAQLGAAVTGAGAATYTAALLSATSNPYWTAAPRSLGTKFGASSVALGAAALSLGEHLGGRPRNARPFDDVAALATTAGLAASIAGRAARADTGAGHAMEALKPIRRLERADLLLAGALPLAAYALNRAFGSRSAALSIGATAAVLAGGFLVRNRMLYAGHASAEHPEIHLRLAQPDNLPRRLPPAHRRGRTALGEKA